MNKKARRQELLNDGLNKMEIERVMQLDRQLKLMERQKETAKKLAAEKKKEETAQKTQLAAAKRFKDSLRDEADRVRAQVSPEQKAGQSIGRLMALRRMGYIGKDVFNSARKDALGGMVDASPVQSSPNAARGSQAAYEIITGVQNVRATQAMKAQQILVKQTQVQTVAINEMKSAINEMRAKLAALESE